MKKINKEEIYINLQGKSKEELTYIYNLLISLNQQVYGTLESDLRDMWEWKCYEFYEGKWCLSNNTKKQEVTIQQLKEILQPMENTKFKKGDVIIITDFGIAKDYGFKLNKPYILAKDFTKENGFIVVKDDGNNINNGWSNAFDLGIKIELHKEPTLQEQLEKAKAEVKRLEDEINRPKVGDWVVNNDGVIWRCSEVDSRHLLTKITDQELINKLNNLIK